ncbi:MAG: glutamate 5-kinase [Chloroflexi bacterium]|nr:glutamate 5-kinase [Chloroflexota bacterium]
MAARKGKARNGPYRRLVVKLGTNILTGGTPHLDMKAMAELVGQVAQLCKEGKEVVVITSGAIAAGRQVLAQIAEGRDIPRRQVLASVGQGRLMHLYDELFGSQGIAVAQALLTKGDLTDRHGYLNARNTLLSLLELGVVPIVNENDVVSVDEIREEIFGDNDSLSAMVANLVDADLLAILTDTEGLYDADPHTHPQARLIRRVDRVDDEVRRWAAGPPGERGSGGMSSKVEAARLAAASGVATVIANGRRPGVLLSLARGEEVGTLFPPTTTRLESRKRWLLSALSRQGRLVVDAGAAKALTTGNRSLLPAGVVAVAGEFDRGEAVAIADEGGRELACGLVSYSSADIQRIKGCRSDEILACLGYEYGEEVVHRNNLVVL